MTKRKSRRGGSRVTFDVDGTELRVPGSIDANGVVHIDSRAFGALARTVLGDRAVVAASNAAKSGVDKLLRKLTEPRESDE